VTKQCECCRRIRTSQHGRSSAAAAVRRTSVLEGLMLMLPLADTLFEAVSDEDGVSLGVADTDIELLADTEELCSGERGRGEIGRQGEGCSCGHTAS